MSEKPKNEDEAMDSIFDRAAERRGEAALGPNASSSLVKFIASATHAGEIDIMTDNPDSVIDAFNDSMSAPNPNKPRLSGKHKGNNGKVRRETYPENTPGS